MNQTIIEELIETQKEIYKLQQKMKNLKYKLSNEENIIHIVKTENPDIDLKCSFYETINIDLSNDTENNIRKDTNLNFIKIITEYLPLYKENIFLKMIKQILKDK